MGGDVVGHHHGPKPPPVPDYRIYKVEDVPRLVRLRDRLALHGLKDPWMRNEVWRYSEYTKVNSFGLLKILVTRGMKLGFVLAVATVGLEQGLNFVLKKDEHHHGEGHH